MALDHLQSSKAVALGDGPRASKKLDYIRRTGDYARKQDAKNVIAWEGNIPSQFSCIDEFLTCAEWHERKNGTIYREVEFALPEELTPSEQVRLAQDIVSQFTERDLDGVTFLITPYAAAIHNRGGKNPHVHLVRAERHMIRGADYSDKDQAAFFKRQNTKTHEKGGLFKLENTSGFRRTVLAWERQTFENISNDHLEQAGRSERVDMRSYAARGLDIVPQKHTGHQVGSVAVVFHLKNCRAGAWTADDSNSAQRTNCAVESSVVALFSLSSGTCLPAACILFNALKALFLKSKKITEGHAKRETVIFIYFIKQALSLW
jgi:hypothetical protein